jgi:hypothetical protein
MELRGGWELLKLNREPGERSSIQASGTAALGAAHRQGQAHHHGAAGAGSAVSDHSIGGRRGLLARRGWEAHEGMAWVQSVTGEAPSDPIANRQ